MSATKWLVRGLLRELRSPAVRPGAPNMYRHTVLETARRFRVRATAWSRCITGRPVQVMFITTIQYDSHPTRALELFRS